MKRIVLLCLAVAALCWIAEAASVPSSISGSAAPTMEKVKPESPEPGTGSRMYVNSLDEGGETCADAVPITSIPFTGTGNTCDNVNDYDFACPYTGSTSPDVVYSYASTAEQWLTFSLCNSGYDTKLYIYEDVCQNPPIACNDDACSDQDGNPYRSLLDCVHLFPDHIYYIVVDGYGDACGDYILDVTECEPPPPPAPTTCPDNSIFAQPPTLPDGDWTAYFSDAVFPNLAYDNFWEVSAPICDIHFWGLTANVSGNSPCNEDPMTFAINFYTTNANGGPDGVACTYTVTLNRQPTGLTYHSVNGFDYPLWYWSTTLDPCCTLNAGWVSIQGVGTGTPNDCFFLWMNSPVGDGVCYQQDESGAMHPYADDLAFCLTPPEQDIDMGDIIHPNNGPFGYPTQVANPGHVLSGIAWLGAGISPEPTPNTFDADQFDDGVVFPPFMVPCTPTSVTVTVSSSRTPPPALYLNAWKDGNNDGDFCDILCPVAGAPGAPEWIIRDEPVTPGEHTFNFIDPGIPDVPPYAGWFRFRLTSDSVGPFGFGSGGLPDWNCQGTFGLDYLGEVEDYWKPDYQLAVNLTSFDALPGDGEVTLRWQTASETSNDYFEILRDGVAIRTIPTQGNGATGHTYTFVDEGLESDVAYTYTLASVDMTGARQELATASATPYSTAAVTEYALYQNYPNPFNPTTTIAFDLMESGLTTLAIYNMMGQEVATLLSNNLEAGHHTVSFDGSSLPSGTYWYRLTAGEFSAVKKMLLMK